MFPRPAYHDDRNAHDSHTNRFCKCLFIWTSGLYPRENKQIFLSFWWFLITEHSLFFVLLLLIELNFTTVNNNGQSFLFKLAQCLTLCSLTVSREVSGLTFSDNAFWHNVK